jgi:hypothetical protein
MATTTTILDGINADAVAFRQARSRYDKAFRLLRMTTPAVEPEHFWPMADAFRMLVLRTMQHRTEGVSDAAADEFMRQAVIGQSSWGLPAAVHFAISYGDYQRKAYAGGDGCRFSFDRGDDGYGDLMDSVVLLGREFNDRLHAGRFYDLRDFNEAVDEQCYASVTAKDFLFQYADDPVGNRASLGSRLRKFILEGENYCGMMLCDAAQKWIALEAVRGTKEDEE